jgi:D-alanyl-D-alanine carboxypeptidase/D-alanyl-D-alanine-endopeptidase (penicillin-binding protein 4)
MTIDPDVPYYTLEVAVTTGAPKSEGSVQMERAPGSNVLRVYGSIAVDAQPDVEEVAIQDPAEYAAVAFKAMLAARGVQVTGKARALHRISSDSVGFLRQAAEPIVNLDQRSTASTANVDMENRACQHCIGKPEERVLASHTSPPLIENLVVTNKVSQNLHAELFLHQLGAAVLGNGSTAQGARVVRAFLTDKVGIDADDFVFFDGSGLSGHDLVAPRATVKLLQYATTQPWFADWKRSLPVGGEDGTLAERFSEQPLKDHLFAKTGTLSEARALSGYLDCASGKKVIFSIMVDNHTPRSHADRDAMDKIVAAIAETN